MKTPASRSSLFLLELILSIFFFSIVSGVCIQLFVKSHFLGVETKKINQATLWSQNIAESFYASDNDSLLLGLFPFQKNAVKDTYLLYFDRNWQIITDSTTIPTYTITLTLSQDDLYRYAFLYVAEIDLIFDLQLKQYQQNRSVQIHE